MEACVMLLLLLIAIQVCVCGGWTKVWTANTNYDNPNNWDIGRAPNCELDGVVFATASPVAVAVTQSIALAGMILPVDGELILPLNAAVDVGNDRRRQHNCDGREARFIGDVARHWFDPHNWRREVKEVSGRRSMDQVVVPHSERVPCYYDSVVFPTNSTFKVILEGIEAEINSLVINGQALDESGLRSLVESETGRRQFQMRSVLRVSGGVCSDLGGCSCGNERPLQQSHICAHVAQPCPPVDCLDPIQPIGFCCQICGAVIDAKIGYRFHMKRFEDFINSYTEKSKYEDVSAYVYRSYNGGVHAVFADRVGLTADMLKHIQRELQNEAQLSALDVSSVTFQVASYWTSGPGTWQRGMSGGAVAALIIGLMAATVIAVLFYMQRHRLMPLAFSFGRFVNEDDNYLSGGGFELAQPASEVSSSTPPDKPPRKAQAQPTNTEPAATVAVGFENPFYTENDGGFVKEVRVMELGENPCYVAFERLEDIPEVTKGQSATLDERK